LEENGASSIGNLGSGDNTTKRSPFFKYVKTPLANETKPHMAFSDYLKKVNE